MPTEENIESLVKKYSLLNAISHNGKADPGSVIGRIMAENAFLRNEAKRVSILASEIIREINRLSQDEQNSILQNEYAELLSAEIRRKKEQSRKDSQRGYTLPRLANATRGQVVTRFPPEPNGFMHLGHAKAAILGSEYAIMYDGQFLLRFDDTNPAAEKKEYYDAFLDSFEWLNIRPNVIRNSSDDIETFYELAEKLIVNGKGYVCTCPKDRMRELRGKGISCEHRNHLTSSN